MRNGRGRPAFLPSRRLPRRAAGRNAPPTGITSVAACGSASNRETCRSRPNPLPYPAAVDVRTATNHGPAWSTSPPPSSVGQPLTREVALVDLVARAVVELALLPLLDGVVGPHRRVDHHELGRDPPRLAQEPHPRGLDEVAVEVPGEDALELAVGERQRERVGHHEAPARHPRRGDLDHRLALVEAGQRAAAATASGSPCRRRRRACAPAPARPAPRSAPPGPPPSRGRGRAANTPVPSYHSSYSAARCS